MYWKPRGGGAQPATPHAAQRTPAPSAAMKLLAIGIVHNEVPEGSEPVILSMASDLSSFSFFQRGG